MDSGILYLLYDWKSTPFEMGLFHSLLDISIKSVRKHGYDGPISIATNNKNIRFESADNIMIPQDMIAEAEEYSIPFMYVKTMLNLLTPFNRTLHLDCDTEAVRPFDNIWSWSGLCMSEMGIYDINYDFIRLVNHSDKEAQYNYNIFPKKDLRFYNLSMMFWDDNNHPLWDLARKEYANNPGSDEMAFMRAMIDNNIYPNPLPPRYNSSEHLTDTVFVHYIGMDKKFHRLTRDNKVSVKLG